MTRMIITDLLAEIDALIPDNTSQQISPQDVRQCLKDIADSTPLILAAITGAGAGLAIPVTPTLIKLPGSFFSVGVSGNSDWIEAHAAPNGELQTKIGVGRLLASLDVVFTAPAGQDIAFTIAKNGIAAPSRTIVSAQGAGNPVSGSFTWLFQNVAVDDKFDIWMQMAAGTSTTVTLTNAFFRGHLLSQYS